MSEYMIDVIIALADGEEPTQRWWTERFTHADVRAGGMPPEVVEPLAAKPRRESDPDSGEQFARVRLRLEKGTELARAQELAHMLTSTLTAEGYTLRSRGRRVEAIAGEDGPELIASFGGPGYSEARVSCQRCLSCCLASETKFGCCGEGMAWSLADIGAALLQGADELVAKVLALPGELDGVKWHPYLKGGICVLHSPTCGCTLPQNLMPLQCRTYICYPHMLLPADLLVDYEGYVDALEEQEMFVEEHMRDVSGVDFGSPLGEIRAAAEKAFAAWDAGKSDR